jgi:cyclic pyranopterin monophosphate synthase
MASSKLTHLDAGGRARMVDVGDKPETIREAVATARVEMKPETARLITDGDMGKGDVLATARIAGIQALKRTAELIPLCHPIRVTGVEIALDVREAEPAGVAIEARVRARDRTGAEMEALTAASVAGLTIYDMCKAVDRGMRLTDVQLEFKAGGRSGTWTRG